MSFKKKAGITLLVLISVAGLVIGAKWVHYRLTHAITNAVFVESDSLTKLAYKRVAGRIEKLYKEEGDRVKVGEPMAKIEDKDYKLKLEELSGHIERLKKEIEALSIKGNSLREEILKSLSLVDSEAQALSKEIEALKARIAQAERDRTRFERLHREGVVPSRQFEEIETELTILKKKLTALEYKKNSLLGRKEVLRAKLKQTLEIDKKVLALKEELKALLKKREDLNNMLRETTLRSPVEGYVVKRYVSRGEVVRQGQYIYAVYDPRDIYLLVLLEETKLQGVEEGNRVYINIDAYPSEKYEGVVEEINHATAGKFALIPRDITAGEFTKVAQRIPIKVRFTKGNLKLLKVGMGGEVAIELKR